MATAVKGARRWKKDLLANNASEETTEKAKKAISEALTAAGLNGSRFVHHLFMHFNHQVPTTDIDTMAVELFADGDKVFQYNPEFVASLEGQKDVLFILLHEAGHVLLRHFFREPELRKNQTWTYACEIVINAMCLNQLGTSWMPHAVRTNKAGNDVSEPTGIDPRKVWKDEYVKAMTEAGLDYVDYDKFTADEHTCFSELMRMPEPPGQGGNGVPQACPHQDGDGEDGQGGSPMDQDMTDEVVRGAIQSVVTDAKQGSENARNEILKLASMTEEGNEEAQRMWGSYGIMGLRGQTDKTRKVEWWAQWLMNTLASILVSGEKLIYPKKRTGMLLALGLDPSPVRRGEETRVRLAIFLDTSGSMPAKVIDEVSRLVGMIPNVVVDFFMFDGVVERLIPGETVKGGGGTNFQNCVDVVEGRLEVEGELADDEYDAVIMLTDGMAPHVSPADPDKWIWLITPNGDEWSDTDGCCHPQMETHIVDTAEAAEAA